MRVSLEKPDGTAAHGESRGHPVPESLMRAGARSALAALDTLAGDNVTLELRGTKSVRAFDEVVVIAALRIRDARGRKDLIGAVLAPEGDLVRGGVLAALDGANRYLAHRLPPDKTDPDPPA